MIRSVIRADLCALLDVEPHLDPLGLERAAMADPTDAVRWLVLADHLDETGDDAAARRAASIRHKYLPDVFPHPFAGP